jgi:hypothetical protein
VDISTALSVDLKNLLRVLDLSDLDLEKSLRALRYDVQLTVSSFVGLSMTLVVDGQSVTLTSMDDEEEGTPIVSSMNLPLTLTSGLSQGSRLVLYASKAGAFVDLAADLTYAMKVAPHELRLDQDLTPVSRRSGLIGVAELSMINRAVGLLIGRGHTPEEAREQLERKAVQARLGVYQVAAYLISMTE